MEPRQKPEGVPNTTFLSSSSIHFLPFPVASRLLGQSRPECMQRSHSARRGAADWYRRQESGTVPNTTLLSSSFLLRIFLASRLLGFQASWLLFYLAPRLLGFLSRRIHARVPVTPVASRAVASRAVVLLMGDVQICTSAPL